MSWIWRVKMIELLNIVSNFNRLILPRYCHHLFSVYPIEELNDISRLWLNCIHLLSSTDQGKCPLLLFIQNINVCKWFKWDLGLIDCWITKIKFFIYMKFCELNSVRPLNRDIIWPLDWSLVTSQWTYSDTT